MKLLICYLTVVTQAHWTHCSVTCGLGYKCEHSQDASMHRCISCYTDCSGKEIIPEATTDPYDALDDASYTPWGAWSPCCPSSPRQAEQRRQRECIDSMRGGSRCQDYSGKRYETRQCKLTLKDNPLIDWNLIFNDRKRRRRRRAGVFDWGGFYVDTLMFNERNGNANKFADTGILHGNDFWGKQKRNDAVERQLEPISIGITATLEDYEPIYEDEPNYEDEPVKEEAAEEEFTPIVLSSHPQAACPAINFMPHPSLFDDYVYQTPVYTNWGEWSGECVNPGDNQQRRRSCVRNEWECEEKDLFQYRGCSVNAPITPSPEIDIAPGYNLEHCRSDKYQLLYKPQVSNCITQNRCFMFRNWFPGNTPGALNPERRVQTLLDCFVTFGLTAQDKRTFLHRAFTIPKLKKAAHDVVDWAYVNEYAGINDNMLDRFT